MGKWVSVDFVEENWNLGYFLKWEFVKKDKFSRDFGGFGDQKGF